MSLFSFVQRVAYHKAPLISAETPLGFKIPSRSTVIGLVDISLMSMVIGSTVWVFFIQSGALMKALGRERFIPIMMKVTKTFMNVNSLCLAGLICTTYLQMNTNNIADKNALYVSLFGFGCSLLNLLYFTPTALSIGGQTMKYRKGKDDTAQNTVSAFVMDGGSAFKDQNTNDKNKQNLAKQMKFYHRSVALLVVSSAASAIGHSYWIVNKIK
eukprot:600078_1